MEGEIIKVIIWMICMWALLILISCITTLFRKYRNNLYRQCTTCNRTVKYIYGKKYQKQFYCMRCYKKDFNVCDICNKVSSEKLRKFHGKNICKKCNNKIKTCVECGKSFGKWEMKRMNWKSYCESCYDNHFRFFETINFNQTKLNPATFKKNPFERYCGVEIECRNRNRNKNCFTKSELKKLYFSQCEDGSLNGGGVEFVSRPMTGDILLDKISNFCKLLNKKKYFVDKSCGLHVHLEVPKKVDYLKKIYLFYEKFEPVIFKMVPKSRQDTGFCKKFERYYKLAKENLFKIKTLNEFKSMVYETKATSRIKNRSSEKFFDKRYCWINFHSIFYRGTLEIRNHSGTTINKKIKNWILLHLTILNYLQKIDLQTIEELKVNKKTFLSIFPKELKDYIKERWEKFENGNKEEKH